MHVSQVREAAILRSIGLDAPGHRGAYRHVSSIDHGVRMVHASLVRLMKHIRNTLQKT